MIEIKLTELLRQKGKTRYWLAEEIGAAQSTINKLSNGKTSRIEFELLEKICNALECEPGDIIKFSLKTKTCLSRKNNVK